MRAFSTLAGTLDTGLRRYDERWESPLSPSWERGRVRVFSALAGTLDTGLRRYDERRESPLSHWERVGVTGQGP